MSALAVDAEGIQELPIGKQLVGRFTPEEIIGIGRATTVYKAYDSLLERHVAIKAIAGDSTALLNGLPILAREIQIQHCMRDLQHVVRMHDLHNVQEAGLSAYFVTMELAEGGNVREWLNKYERNWSYRRKHGWELFLKICRGYAAVYEQGLFLLDPKPENVLFVDGAPKVSDVGLAVYQGNDWRDTIALEIKPSERGTFEYMSPEQVRCCDLDDLSPACDVYSVARIGHEILHPLGRSAFDITPEQMRTGPPAYPIIPDIGEEINDVLARGLEADPEDRYTGMGEFLEALRESTWDTKEPLASAPESPSTIGLPHRTKRRGRNGQIRRKRLEYGATGEVEFPSASSSQCIPQDNSQKNEADRLCRLIVSEEASWDLQTLRDYARQAERLYPDLPELKLALIKLESREQRYRQLISQSWDALRGMDLEMSTCLLAQALALNPGDIRIKRSLQVASWLFEEVESALGGHSKQEKRITAQKCGTSCRQRDSDDLDTIMDEVVEYIGAQLGIERATYET